MLLAKCGSFDGVEQICQSRSTGEKDSVQWFWAQHNWNFFGTAFVMFFSAIYCITRPYNFVKDNDILLDRKRKLQFPTNPAVLRNVTYEFDLFFISPLSAVCALSLVVSVFGTSILILDGIRLCALEGPALAAVVFTIRSIGYIWSV
jgi:hypothetical protein